MGSGDGASNWAAKASSCVIDHGPWEHAQRREVDGLDELGWEHGTKLPRGVHWIRERALKQRVVGTRGDLLGERHVVEWLRGARLLIVVLLAHAGGAEQAAGQGGRTGFRAVTAQMATRMGGRGGGHRVPGTRCGQVQLLREEPPAAVTVNERLAVAARRNVLAGTTVQDAGQRDHHPGAALRISEIIHVLHAGPSRPLAGLGSPARRASTGKGVAELVGACLRPPRSFRLVLKHLFTIGADHEMAELVRERVHGIPRHATIRAFRRTTSA